MNILALDPSTHCGWAVGRFLYGVWDLKVRRDESQGMRLLRFKAKVGEICTKEKVGLVVFERPAGRHKTDIINHSMLVAIIEDYCETNHIEYKGYSPSEIKKHATGKGNCNKEAMIKAAKEKLGYGGSNDNEADALWLLDLAKSEFDLWIPV